MGMKGPRKLRITIPKFEDEKYVEFHKYIK